MNSRLKLSYDMDIPYDQLIKLAVENEAQVNVRRGTKMAFHLAQKRESLEIMLGWSSTIGYSEPGFFIETIHGKAYSSRVPLSSLQRTTFHQLRLEMPNFNHYVLARVYHSLLNKVKFNTGYLLDDENGDFVRLELMNCTANMPLHGEKIIIKEPYFKLSTRCLPTIRCDSPTDIIIIHENHPYNDEAEKIVWKNRIWNDITSLKEWIKKLPKMTPLEWLRAGDKMGSGLFVTYSNCLYLCGIKECGKSDRLRIALNRKLLANYIKPGCYEKGIECAENLLKSHPKDEEALDNLALCYLKLNEYDEAFKYATRFCQIYKSNCRTKTVKRLFEEHHDVLKAYETAKTIESITYNVRKKSKSNNEMHPENLKFFGCANSKSPAVEINKSYKLAAIAKIKPNSVIIVANSIANSVTPESHPSNLFHLCLDEDPKRNSWPITKQLAHLLYNTPNTLSRRIFELRSSTGNEVWNPRNMYCDDASEELTFDIGKIKDICHINNFEVPLKNFNNIAKAIYDLPLYIKHSCNPNCDFEFLCYVMVVKTKRIIRVDQEISIDYANYVPASERRKYLRKRLVNCDVDNCLKCNP